MHCTAESRYTFILFKGDKDKAHQYDFHFNLVLNGPWAATGMIPYTLFVACYSI